MKRRKNNFKCHLVRGKLKPLLNLIKDETQSIHFELDGG